ncbi:hypothetical protein BASA83_013747 [Batrachochytrium salamandrivorans]|nr:hypothetical protein BASA83_013747 [Batrachochytrium salamandrivorans]
MHDISYQYGFTESAGNFQKDNFGLGGEGNDAVTINVLNPSDTNNAEFLAPPDGQPGVMNIRLTGGASADLCLRTIEAGGMGEGWSDIIAMIVMAKKSDTATTQINMGAYVRGRLPGFRSFSYTTDIRENPLKYSFMRVRDTVHLIGEVWAAMLWEVYWNLVTKHGFSENLYDASQSAGNVVAMKIIIGGMMLQQCNPNFFNARQAIIDADVNHYGGANRCEIYKGFAKRGFGLGATNTYMRTNDFSVPPECQ